MRSMPRKKLTINEFSEMFPDTVKAEFKNEYGEKFTIFNTGFTIMFGGDETDQELMPLFNDRFNVWNITELENLAAAIEGTCMSINEKKAMRKSQ